MKFKIQFLAFAFLVSSIQGFTQNSPSFFKVYPTLDGSEPVWVSKMYSENPNVFEVVNLYHEYYQTYPLIKNIHTQNFKHWLRIVKNYVQADGLIVIPTNEENLAKLANLKAQRGEESEAKTTTRHEQGGLHQPKARGSKCIFDAQHEFL